MTAKCTAMPAKRHRVALCGLYRAKGGTSAMNELDKELDEFMEWIRSSEMDFDIDLPDFDFDLPDFDFDIPEL